MEQEETSPATTPYSISSQSVTFDPKTVGETDEEVFEFVVSRLFGEYSDTIVLPETATAEDLKAYLQADWKFRIKSDPALAQRLNAMVPLVIEEYYQDLYNALRWKAIAVPEQDPPLEKNYNMSAPGNGKGAVATAADPVNLFNGDFSFTATDLHIKGAGIDFSFVRSYRQSGFYNGPLGHKWDHNYNLWIRVAGDNSYIAVSSGQFLIQHFKRHAVHDYYFAPDGSFEIITEVNGTYQLRGPDGKTITYHPHSIIPDLHVASRIADKFGNYLQFFYQDGLLVRIEINHPDRKVFFTYDAINRITVISDFTNRKWRYTYDDFNDLVAVTSPGTALYKKGFTALYQYSSNLHTDVSAQHNLTTIIDPDGRIFLENEYGIEKGLLGYNRVIRQRQGSGDTIFEYSDVVEEFDVPYAAHERPAHQTLVTERDGKQIRYLFNSFGNTILREEYARINGIPRIISTHYRYNKDGNLIAILSPGGTVIQYLFGRDYYEKKHAYDELYRYETDDELTPRVKMGFNNLLATVQRGRFYNVPFLNPSGLWSSKMFPDVYDTSPDDVITKFVYEEDFNQMISSSDPRFTRSADPDFNENADYQRHLTRYDYTSGGGISHLKLSSITLPSPTLPDGNSLGPIVTTFDYDNNGRLLQTLGPNGLKIENTYYAAADGLLNGYHKSTVIDPQGLDIKSGVECDELGRITAFYRPQYFDAQDDRYFSKVDYNELDQVTKNTSTKPFSVSENFEYDKGGNIRKNVVELKDDNNVHTGFFETHSCYDDELHLIKRTRGNLVLGEIQVSKGVFDRSGRPLISIEFSGFKEKYFYNERGLKSKVIEDYGSTSATSKFYYDANGKLIKTIDALGNASSYIYDALGRLIELEDPMGSRTICHYDKAGNVIVQLEFEKLSSGEFRLLNRKEYQYDEMQRLILEGINKFDTPVLIAGGQLRSVFVANGPGQLLTTQYFYDRRSDLFKVIDYSGRIHLSFYDLMGRLIKTTDPLGNEHRFTYDKENNLLRSDRKEVVWNKDYTQIVAEHHFAEASTYDELNRITTHTNSLGNSVAYRYDSRGNVVKWFAPLNSRGESEYDLFSRLVARKEFLHTNTPGETPQVLRSGYTYDKQGYLAQVSDPLGRLSKFLYDSRGQMISTILPDNSADLTQYDKNGNIIRYRDRNGLIKNFEYDAVNRNTALRIDKAGLNPLFSIAGAVAYRTDYDGLGRITAAENDVAHIVFEHNSLDDTLLETVYIKGHPVFGTQGLAIRRSYNTDGQPATVEYPSGRKIEFEYDALERISKVRQLLKGNNYPGVNATPDQYVVCEVEYEGLRRKTVSRSNNAFTEYQYDLGGRVIGITHRHGGQKLLESQFLYDGLDNMRKKAERFANVEKTSFYRYDSLSRLIESRDTSDSGITDLSAIGPSLQPLPSTIPNFQASIDGLMTGVTTPASRSYLYDAQGNRISSSSGTTTVNYQPNGLDQYELNQMRYDNNGNLIEDASFRYTYDHVNQLSRVEKKSGGAETEFSYDPIGRRCLQSDAGSLLLMVYDGDELLEEYVDGTLKSSLLPDKGEKNVLLRSKDQKELFYLHDLTNSTRCLLDGGQVTARFLFDEFGNLQNNGITTDNEFLFGGKRWLEAIGKYDFNLRIYDAALGRFIQRDPLGFADSLNLYTYVGNNPLTFTDPFGTERQTLVLGRDVGADFASEPLDFNDPNLGMDSISKFYFREDGIMLRWNENTESWIEDFSGVTVIMGQAPPPKRSWLERYMGGVKRAVMAPVNLLKDTGAKVVDMGTQGFAVLGKVTGGWDVGYTTWSSTSKAVEAGVPQSTLIWNATGGLIVDPIVGLGDQVVGLASGSVDFWGFAGELVGNTFTGGVFKPNVGRYSKVKGHHIHQSAAYAKPRHLNPNHDAAITIQQGVKGFTKKDHSNASRAQRNINRAAWDKKVKRPIIPDKKKPRLWIKAEGKVKKNAIPTPSQWFEDVKAFYSLRAAGIDPNRALQLVEQSLEQIQAAGVSPKRVPKM